MSKMLLRASLLAFCCVSAVFGAAQPIPGVDILAKCNPCGIPPGKPRMSMGTGGLPLPNDFFYSGFVSSAQWPSPEDAFGSDALLDSTMLHQQRHTAPNFSSLPSDNVQAEIVDLAMQSDEPLSVGSGLFYDWKVTMQSSAMGQLTLSNESANGGRVTASYFDVAYQVDFTPVGSGSPLSFNGTDRLFYDGTPFWSNTFPDGSLPPGGSNFVLGSDGFTVSTVELQSQSGIWSFQVQQVPEPGTASILVIGVMLVINRSCRSRNSKQFHVAD